MNIMGLSYSEVFQNAIRTTGIPVESYTENFGGFTVKFNYPKTEQHCEMARFVTITTDKQDFSYTVKFEEISYDPVFITHKEIFSGIDNKDQQRQCTDVVGVYRRITNFLLNKIDPAVIPPHVFVDKRNSINDSWMGENYKVELFLKSSEIGDDWYFKIVHVLGIVICDSLSPSTADGHTYSMLADSAGKSFERGILEGQARAGERIAKLIFETAFNNSEREIHNSPAEIQLLLKTGTMRNNVVFI